MNIGEDVAVVSDYNTVYDVIIAGGGTAGVAAAIASARTGASTLLIERFGTLGGQLSVSGPPGFAYAYLFNSKGQQDAAGIMEETHNRLLKAGHALPHCVPRHRVSTGYSFSYIDPDWFIFLIFDMMEEEGVTLLLNSWVVDAIMEGDTIKGVVVENADGRVEIKGKVVIDCTGEAYLSAKAGVETVCAPKEGFPPHSMAFTVDGVDWDEFLSFVRSNPDQIAVDYLLADYADITAEEIREVLATCTDIREIGEIMGFFDLRNAALANGDWHEYSGAGFFITPKEGGVIQALFQHSSQYPDCLPTSAWDITKCIIECRKQNQIAWRFFKNYIPGFKNSYITKQAPELRIREGPRIVGDYTFCAEDVLEARLYDDVIGKSHFHTDTQHVATKDTLRTIEDQKVVRTPKDGKSYDLPYRCMVPKKIENLLAAGKHVSANRDVYLRYLMQTMITGQAAGVAAAISAKTGKSPRELEKDLSEVQRILIEQGAILRFEDEEALSWQK